MKTLKTFTQNYYFNTEHPCVAYDIGLQLTELILSSSKPINDIVILCIGTDRSTGDSLGPIVGYKLSSKTIFSSKLSIYGTLDMPVHAANLNETIQNIKYEHKDAYIIAIDASLGLRDHIGYVTLGLGPLKPGLGVNKKLPDVGDIHITGIVNVSGSCDPALLQTTRLKTVMKLADVISTSLIYCLNPSAIYSLS